MIPLIVLGVSFVVFLALGRLGVRRFSGGVVCLRWALAVMFLVTASAHWGDRREDLIRMVPSVFPAPGFLVTLTGVAEILGAIGLVIPRVAPAAATGLALLLIAVFPANVHAATAGLTIAGEPVPGVIPRALIQLVFLGAVVIAGWWPRLSRRGAAALVTP